MKVRNAFHALLAEAGPITYYNPELLRLSKATGLSASHLFRVALGDRIPSRAAAISISRACRGKTVTVDGLLGK